MTRSGRRADTCSARSKTSRGITARHRDAWLARWKASDVRIEGDPFAQRALRLAIYHLSSAANPEDERVSIGARGLSGTAYQGHVFWDTDIFMLPFFTLTYPEAARALVMYRYHTLAGARAKAARLGYRGALYAWESTDSGEEVTPAFVVAPDGEVIRILTGEQEQHISADVAFGVWKYWEATGDERFLLQAGAEILIETARFWASRAAREEDGRYHIRGVIGPDEYHETVDDNAYTNGLAQWNLEIGREATSLVAERWPEQWRLLSRRLGLEPEEPREWLRVARDLYTGFHEQTGLFEQFHGYFGLEEIDLAAFASRIAPMDVLLGRERIQRSKIIKQADVVMLVYLLWERLPLDVRRANFEYYEPRCGHGSSLSPAIHALVGPPERGSVPWDLQHVLVPHDGTPTTSAALQPAAEIAEHAGAELLVAHVTDVKPAPAEPGSFTTPGYVDQPQHEWPAWSNEFAQRLACICPLGHLHVRIFLAHGNPAAEIMRLAKEQSTDLIILAWRGVWEYPRAAIFKQVMGEARCPIMVVRA
jgi:trehalose/maltose hydrolase-like predicted phosphorylase/nucleotide-binding universal stress UspA family protein